jgi:hypothetical protein
MKKIVKTSVVLILLALVYLSTARSQAPAPVPCPYTLTIKTDKQAVTWGEPLLLHVAIKNATAEKLLMVPYDIKEMGFVVDVTQGGSPVILTEHGKAWPHSRVGWTGSGPFTQLEPGAVFNRKINISDLYDLTSPGKYSIQLHCADISSNAITVEIIP